MEDEVRPLPNEYWSRDTFPRDLIGKFRQLDLIRKICTETGERHPDASVLEGSPPWRWRGWMRPRRSVCAFRSCRTPVRCETSSQGLHGRPLSRDGGFCPRSAWWQRHTARSRSRPLFV
ncbi:acyl-CoA dehydrogenase family protein [Deinococcus peraridilitoris]|uniref:acyl-CoA dehydrogenase family protein n=1 Tax=Deinococcus peraridilitoris TaxID=432329 RepID=UPI001FE1E238|nr:acyl-CoA dehydrogenase family protein [Deinococcus peraridilitoris]